MEIFHNKMKWLLVVLYIPFVFSSCISSKQNTYFKTLERDTSIARFVSAGLDPKIVPGDVLFIRATSLSKEEDFIFNQSGNISGNNTTNVAGYAVDKSGNIEINRIGVISTVGLTRQQLASKIREALLAYMKDPVVKVSFLNHKITVMGEVARPQVIQMPEEQMTIIDAIVMSGDVTKDANREKVLVIREEGDKKNIKHISLADHSIFASPWYYLQANDIVYVAPDTVSKEKELKRRNTQAVVSMVVSGASLLIIILDRIFR